MSTVRRSVLFSASEKYATQALSIATTIVMARILSPAETGLYFTAYSVILLADGFRDFGVGAYLVQARTLERREVRTAFTVTLFLSFAMAAAIALGAGAIAGFMATPHWVRC